MILYRKIIILYIFYKKIYLFLRLASIIFHVNTILKLLDLNLDKMISIRFFIKFILTI